MESDPEKAVIGGAEGTGGPVAPTPDLPSVSAGGYSEADVLAAVSPAQPPGATGIIRQVLADYLSYWAAFETTELLSVGSVERYVLNWCEDPSDFVIEMLLCLVRFRDEDGRDGGAPGKGFGDLPPGGDVSASATRVVDDVAPRPDGVWKPSAVER